MPRLKICGTTHPDDARFCDQLQVDFLGFIFHPESPRFVRYAAAEKMIQSLQHAKAVGVFVHQPAEEIVQIARDLNLWGVQIYQDMVFEASEFKVIRVQRMRGAQDLPQLARLQQSRAQDYILVDAYHEQQYGGTGQRFDWDILPADLSNIFLAGGITIADIDRLKALQPFAIDLVSGVESSPGRKDFAKLEALVARLK